MGGGLQSMGAQTAPPFPAGLERTYNKGRTDLGGGGQIQALPSW